MEPFGQADSTLSRRHEGTGLGLPLTKGLVELHEGTLWLESEWRKGTVANVRLPAHRMLTALADDASDGAPARAASVSN